MAPLTYPFPDELATSRILEIGAVAELARVQSSGEELNSAEFSDRQELLPHPSTGCTGPLDLLYLLLTILHKMSSASCQKIETIATVSAKLFFGFGNNRNLRTLTRSASEGEGQPAADPQRRN